ncbi:MAG: ABC transporter substrate-binding protein, partial [Bacteroidota bacterium]
PASIYDPEGLMEPFAYNDIIDPEKVKSLAKDNPNLKKFGDQFSAAKYSREVVSGAGAYTLEEWVEGEKIVLKRKENWWGDALVDKNPMLTANPDELVFKFIPDVTSTISLMRNGEVDIARDIPNTLFKELEQDQAFTKDVQLLAPDSYLLTFIALNTQNPKLADRRVRRALAHLLDVEEIIKTVKKGMAIPIAGPIPPTVPFSHKGLALIDLNLDKAKTLLAEAGWKDSNNDGTVDKVIDGQREELVLSYLMTPSSEVSTDIALIFQNVAKSAGIKIEPEVKEANAFREGLKKRDFDMYTAGSRIEPDSYDPYQTWHSSSNNPSGSNRVGFGSAESDAIIERIRTTLDKEERTQLLLRLQEMIYEEQPAIYVYNTKEAIAVSKRLKNVQPSFRSPGYFENYFQLK